MRAAASSHAARGRSSSATRHRRGTTSAAATISSARAMARATGCRPASATSLRKSARRPTVSTDGRRLSACRFRRREGTPKPAEPCAAAVVVASTVLPSLVAPILPQPLGFVVVDTRAGDGQSFPVLFHDQPEHAGVENISPPNSTRRDSPGCEWVSSTPPKAAKASAHEPPVSTAMFSGRYEGSARRFVAARIAGTPWVLLIDYALDDVDTVAAATAARAAQAWLAIGVSSPLAGSSSSGPGRAAAAAGAASGHMSR